MPSEEDSNFSGLFTSHDDAGEIGLITGEIPTWLAGTYAHVGPGKWDLEKCTMNFWQDGYSIVSTFEINTAEGQVRFRKSFLQSDAYKKAMEAGKPICTEFATAGLPENIKPFLQMKLHKLNPKNASDNCITCIHHLGRDSYIAGESCFFHQYDFSQHSIIGEKLSTLKTYGVVSITPHPLQDQHGDIYNVGFRTFPKLLYCVIKIPSAAGAEKPGKDLMAETKIIAQIPTRWIMNMSGMHSFGMSLNYIVLIEQPLLPNPAKGAYNLANGLPLNKCIDWSPDRKNRFYIVEKSTGKVVEMKIKSKDAFIFTHFVNCFEMDGHIILDVNCYSNPDFLDYGHLNTLRSNKLFEFEGPTVHRYIIPLNLKKNNKKEDKLSENLITLESQPQPHVKAEAYFKGKSLVLSPQILLKSDTSAENFVVNPNYQSKPYKYFYGLTNSMIKTQKMRNAIIKKNIESGEVSILWQGESHQYPNQPVFLPSPNSNKEEDDGILIFSVSSSKQENDKNLLVVLDAKSGKEMALVKFSTRIPLAMHSNFISKC